jgi:hypothetical protein
MRSVLLLIIIAALAGAPGGAVVAQDDDEAEEPAVEEAYLDDRSTPEAVIASYYNAINRHEYARAFSYYGEDAAPSDYDRWERGYEDTLLVEARFGEVTEEGAAGSVYYNVPVKLDVETTEGQHRYFLGCYVVRLANPAIQGVPFVPMHIEDASLRRSTSRTPPPASCD